MIKKIFAKKKKSTKKSVKRDKKADKKKKIPSEEACPFC
jgi:hypothetical protein